MKPIVASARKPPSLQASEPTNGDGGMRVAIESAAPCRRAKPLQSLAQNLAKFPHRSRAGAEFAQSPAKPGGF